MFKSYLKTAIRNLVRHRVYSAINLIGMSIALAFCILTFLFVHREWTYDAFHENADRIYLVYIEDKSDGHSDDYGYSLTPAPLGPALTEAFSDMQTVRFSGDGGKIGIEDRVFQVSLGFIDPNFLEIFSFPIIHGDSTRVLRDKYSALITKKIAQKYFNKANPVGELLPIQRGEEIQNYIITGIVKNAPKNSTIQFDVLLPFERASWIQAQEQWKTHYLDTYMLLPPNISPNSLEQQFPRWAKIWWGKDTKIWPGENREIQLKLLPITQMHFAQNIMGDRKSVV